MEIKNNQDITKIFNRQIGKILSFLDDANVSNLLKSTIKNQLWLCHDDIQNKVSEVKEDAGTQD
jgi:hypothetical protein